MGTFKIRIYVRCANGKRSEISSAAIWQIEHMIEKYLVFLLKQLSGGPVVVEQILVDRDPLDSIGGEDDLPQFCP